MLQGAVNRPANRARSKRADGLIDRHNAADFRRIESFAADDFHLRIDHLDSRGPLLIHFGFAVENQLLAVLQAAFEVATVKEFAGQGTGFVLNKQVVDRVATTHGADGLAAGHRDAQGVNRVGPNVFNLGKLDAVFITKRQIPEQILQSVDTTLGEQLGTLRANALNRLDGRLESTG